MENEIKKVASKLGAFFFVVGLVVLFFTFYLKDSLLEYWDEGYFLFGIQQLDFLDSDFIFSYFFINSILLILTGIFLFLKKFKIFSVTALVLLVSVFLSFFIYQEPLSFDSFFDSLNLVSSNMFVWIIGTSFAASFLLLFSSFPLISIMGFSSFVMVLFIMSIYLIKKTRIHFLKTKQVENILKVSNRLPKIFFLSYLILFLVALLSVFTSVS